MIENIDMLNESVAQAYDEIMDAARRTVAEYAASISTASDAAGCAVNVEPIVYSFVMSAHAYIEDSFDYDVTDAQARACDYWLMSGAYQYCAALIKSKQ